MGVLPKPLDGSEFSVAWKEYEANEEREGWFKGDGYERMHLQGRRWAGSIKDKFNAAKNTQYKGSIYDAEPTFASYGVPHGSAGMSFNIKNFDLLDLFDSWFFCVDGVSVF